MLLDILTEGGVSCAAVSGSLACYYNISSYVLFQRLRTDAGVQVRMQHLFSMDKT
jgi:hypothetical protein